MKRKRTLRQALSSPDKQQNCLGTASGADTSWASSTAEDRVKQQSKASGSLLYMQNQYHTRQAHLQAATEALQPQENGRT